MAEYVPQVWVDLVTDADAAHMNHMEAGILNAVPKPPAPPDRGPVLWDAASSSWVSALLDNRSISGAAAIARSKLDFGAGLVNADIAAAAAIAVSKIAAPYTTYTPVLTATGGGSPALGNATGVVARYLQIGKLVHCYGAFTQGTTTNYGTGTLLISIPVAAANTAAVGTGSIFHQSTLAQYLTQPTLADVNRFQIILPNGYGGASAAISGSAGYPWTWAPGDNIVWNLTYEAA